MEAALLRAEEQRGRHRHSDAAHAVAELSAEYWCTVPYQVKLLGYDGRQIEVGIAAGRMATIARASTDLEAAWNRIR